MHDIVTDYSELIYNFLFSDMYIRVLNQQKCN